MLTLTELQKIAAYHKNHPIINPEQIDRVRLNWSPIDDEWKAWLRKTDPFWFSESTIDLDDFSDLQRPHVPQLIALRDRLLTFGGEEACLPAFDEDLDAILDYGQFWYSDHASLMPGNPGECHANTAGIWHANPNQFRIATGYALSPDGMWRQHSWCIEIRPRINRIIETTTKRVSYFGFVLGDAQSKSFWNQNG